MFEIILAVDSENNIGSSTSLNTKNGLAWDIKEDMKHFVSITKQFYEDKQTVIVMGRKTADTFKNPLPNRLNVVLTSQNNYRSNDGFISKSSFISILEYLSTDKIGKIFIIGGAKLIDEALKFPRLISKVHLTRINKNYNLDINVNNLIEFVTDRINVNFDCTISKDVKDHNDDSYLNITFDTYVTTSSDHEENNYLDVMSHLLTQKSRDTRNARTLSDFGTSLEFDLKKGFPALTTKRLYWRGVVEELLFFLSGSTDNSILKERKVHIWDGNTNKEFIDKMNLPYEENDMGPMYGFMWRYYGAEYKGKNHDYTGQGCDQFEEVINLLLNDPHSRRILMTTYNPSQAKQGVLYPCHGLTVQFYVRDDNSIDCQMYQRSADWFLGVPFNIASYALLMHIIVNIVNNRKSPDCEKYNVGKLKMVFGDYHLYKDHVEQAITQSGRVPTSFPSLKINKEITSIEPSYFLNDLSFEDFTLCDYSPQGTIKANMIA